MTIQLLQTWNGYPARIYTWSAAEESRLIALGLARSWVPALDGASRLGEDEVTSYTSAQLAEMSAAGTLNPDETYIASDDPERTPQTAKNTSTLIAAAFNSAGAPWAVQSNTNYLGTQIVNLEGREEFLLRSDGDKAAVYSVFGDGEQWNNLSLAATVPVTASIAGTQMTVSVVGTATNPNGSTMAGAVNRGHYITGDVGIPADTYVIFDPADTGVHGTGVYTLSADCGSIPLKTLYLSCANGVGGVLERVTDTFMGSGTTVDIDAKKVWRLSIKPTHRVTVGHGRTSVQSNELAPRKHYRVEALFRFHDSSNGSWQQTSSGVAMMGPVALASISLASTSGFDQTDSMGNGVQYANNGMFSVNYNRGSISTVMRNPDEEYAKKQIDGYWSWEDEDRTNQFDQANTMYFMKGYEPIKLVYEFFLDERMTSEGGQGWLKCWINNMMICDYTGPTLYPAGRLDGLVSNAQCRLGMYDVTYASVADNTLCSAVRSTAVERNMDIKYWRVKEIA